MNRQKANEKGIYSQDYDEENAADIEDADKVEDDEEQEDQTEAEGKRTLKQRNKGVYEEDI